MKVLNCPYKGCFLVILETCRLKKGPNFDGLILRQYGHESHSLHVSINLYPGEWYEVRNIYFATSSPVQSPSISLKLQRSFKERKWVKEKLITLTKEVYGSNNWICNQQTILCSVQFLNGRAEIVNSKEEAMVRRKMILEDINDPPSRFHLLNTD